MMRKYDVIVVGGGHAGTEAAAASARLGVDTLLLTMEVERLGELSCNPAIGGLAKSHLVYEIDLLGGLMGKVAEKSAIQYRMLNRSKGPAVWSLRAQMSRSNYKKWMLDSLLQIENLEIREGLVESLAKDSSNGEFCLECKNSDRYFAKKVIITAGTFLNGKIYIGDVSYSAGRINEFASN